MGQNFETHHIVPSLHDLQSPLPKVFRPIHQLPRISTVGPDPLETGKAAGQFLQNQLGSVSILDIRRMNHAVQDQPERVNDDVPLAPLDFLARIVPSGAPFSVVLVLWLSMMTALGLASRPAFWRTQSRRAL